MSSDADRLERMAEELREVRSRTCEPKSNTNPRYLRFPTQYPR